MFRDPEMSIPITMKHNPNRSRWRPDVEDLFEKYFGLHLQIKEERRKN